MVSGSRIAAAGLRMAFERALMATRPSASRPTPNSCRYRDAHAV